MQVEMVEVRAKNLFAVIPDLIRDPRLTSVEAASEVKRRGSRIKSGMTVELKSLYSQPFSFKNLNRTRVGAGQ
jgi:hypothetical protein